MVYGFADAASGRALPTPAAATSTSTAPNASTQAATMASLAASSVVSIRTASDRCPVRLHAPGRLLGRGLIQVGHAHLRPLLREPERARAPDAAAAAGDHRDLAREPSRHGRSSLS